MDYPQRGEIWLVSLDPVIGHEIGKVRPALVVSNNYNNQFAQTVTILPITSKVTKVYPFEVFLSKHESGLPKDSKIKANQVRTIDKKRLIKIVGTISKERLKEVEQALLIHLGIEPG